MPDINMSGKMYKFTPGKGGSLISKEPVKKTEFMPTFKPKRAKSISKERMQIVKALVGKSGY